MIEDLLARLGAEDIRGTNEGYECRCPVCHSNRRSFRVAYMGHNGRPGAFTCHKCHIAGDLIGLTMRAFHIDRTSAEQLAKNAGQWILVHKKAKTEYPEVNAGDIAPYRKTLSVYLAEDRGYDPEVIYLYRIGMDEFTNEIVIPTYDIDGKLVGITRRVAEPGAPYIHIPFPKSEHVFGLDLVKNCSRIFICEGQLDPLGAEEVLDEDEGACAINGSYMSEEQADLLVSTGAELVMMFDNDKMGVACTHQSIQLLREHGARQLTVALYPGNDPGKLPFRPEAEVERVSTFSWLSNRKNRNPYPKRRKNNRHATR